MRHKGQVFRKILEEKRALFDKIMSKKVKLMTKSVLANYLIILTLISSLCFPLAFLSLNLCYHG